MKTALAFAAALVLLAAACGGGTSAYETPATTAAPPAPAPATTATVPAEQTSFRLYFVRGERLGVAGRNVAKTQAVATAALSALLAGPTAAERDGAGLGSEIPQDTRLLGVAVADGVATVDLSRAFESGGGSLSLQLRVAQVVFTLTQFPTVERVRFQLDGAPATAIGGEGSSSTRRPDEPTSRPRRRRSSSSRRRRSSGSRARSGSAAAPTSSRRPSAPCSPTRAGPNSPSRSSLRPPARASAAPSTPSSPSTPTERDASS